MISIPSAPIPPPVSNARTEHANFGNSIKRQITNFNKVNLKEVDKNIRGEKVVVERGISSYGISDDEDKAEYYDSMEEVISKVKQLAETVRNSKHMVVFTGAG